jgi:hypothetical protein
MRAPVFVFPVALLVFGAQTAANAPTNAAALLRETTRRYRPVTVDVARPSPNVDISRYVLITDDVEAARDDARRIMRLKADLPLAVQRKDRTLFDQLFAAHFTFRGEDEFWTREEYIRNRVERSEKVGAVRYDNLVLQFFGPVAVLTYRNTVKVTDASGKEETLHMSWADVYVQEAGEWKIGAIHLIDKK